MKHLGLALGVAALCALVVHAGTIQPTGAPKAGSVGGTLDPGGSGPRDGLEIIYSNVTTSSSYGFTWCDGGGWTGEDIEVSLGGTLEALKFSVAHKVPDGTTYADPLLSCDMDVRFCDFVDPDICFAGPIIFHLTFGAGLPAGTTELGEVAHFEVSGLSSEGIKINRSNFILKARLFNRVPSTAGELGQDMYTPPTIGISDDLFWFDETACDPPGTAYPPGWYWFLGDPIANFYWEIGVIDAGPITFPVSVTPDLGVAASFEVDPADDSDPPQGGFGSPLTTPAYLLYDPPKDMSFRKPSLVIGGKPRKFLGWFFRASDPYYDVSLGPPDYETVFPVGSAQFTGLQIVFNTEIAVEAKKTTGAAQSVAVTFRDRPVAPPPPCEGDLIVDIDGKGGGTTPLVRKWNPIDTGTPEFDYNMWVCHFVPAALTDGTPFLKYLLTLPDGSESEFIPSTCPQRVCIRVDAFTKVVALYGEAFTKCDCNCDGKIDAFDIDPFVLALTDPDGYAAKYPDCDISTADVNGDGKVDAFDIDPFVKCLVP